MSVHIIHKEYSGLSKKAQSLNYLQGQELPVPPTLVVPMFTFQDHISLNELGDAKFYYVRLCFRDHSIKRRAGRIVNIDDIDKYLIDLAEISASNAADLLIQPFIIPRYSGAVIKIDSTVFIEATYGIAPTLFHRGRVSHRAILAGKELVCSEVMDQGIALVWENGSVVKVNELGWNKYNPQMTYIQIAESITILDNILLEWAVIDDSLFFFDHKDIPPSSCFLQLLEKPSVIPRCVTTTMKEVEESPLKSVLFLDYPDLDYLHQARGADYVVIDSGALLSHVSIYSIFENYKCVFKN